MFARSFAHIAQRRGLEFRGPAVDELNADAVHYGLKLSPGTWSSLDPGIGEQPRLVAALGALVNAMGTLDQRLLRHGSAVAELSRPVATAMGLPSAGVATLGWAALLHDIGTLGMSVLTKAGSMSVEERCSVMEHTQVGADIIAGADPGLWQIAQIVLTHHERWDGRGYPTGHKGHDIPLTSRILAVADAFDALTTEQLYRPASPASRVWTMLVQASGSRFDPEVMAVFNDVHRRS